MPKDIKNNLFTCEISYSFSILFQPGSIMTVKEPTDHGTSVGRSGDPCLSISSDLLLGKISESWWTFTWLSTKWFDKPGFQTDAHSVALLSKITLKINLSHFSNHFQDDLNQNQWDRLPNHWSNHGYDISSQSQRVSRRRLKTRRLTEKTFTLEIQTIRIPSSLDKISFVSYSALVTLFAYAIFKPATNLKIMNMKQGPSWLPNTKMTISKIPGWDRSIMTSRNTVNKNSEK